MRRIKPLLFVATLVLLFGACKDPDLAPIATFDQSTKGAYVRVVEQSENTVNLDDIDNSQFTYTVEFVDLEKGDLVSEYNLQVSFQDNDDSNGDKSVGPFDIRNWTAADFSTNKDGFKGLENIQISAKEVLDKTGITAADISYGDIFKFTGSVTKTDGAVYSAENSSASVNGASFRGFFNFSLTARCPTNLAGSYGYTTTSTSVVCGITEKEATEDLSGMVTIEALEDGKYQFSDWSFGSFSVCYEAGTIENSSSLQFADYCDQLNYVGKTDSFGDVWTFSSTIDGNDWTINWSTSAGDAGKTVVTNPNGWDLVIDE